MDYLEDKDNFMIKFDQDLLSNIKEENWDHEIDEARFYNSPEKQLGEPHHEFGNKVEFRLDAKSHNSDDHEHEDGMNIHKLSDRFGIHRWKESHGILKNSENDYPNYDVSKNSSELRVAKRIRIDSSNFPDSEKSVMKPS
jgi:hypothetical protein